MSFKSDAYLRKKYAESVRQWIAGADMDLEGRRKGLNMLTAPVDDNYNLDDIGRCSHEFVNVGFTSRIMVCKHCDLEEN